jgi:hypothetical protein
VVWLFLGGIMSKTCLVLIVCGVFAGAFAVARAAMPGDSDRVIIKGEVVKRETIANAQDIAGDGGRGACVGSNVDHARPLEGDRDELSLFRRALSPAEVQQTLVVPPQLKAFAPDPADGAQLVMSLLRWLAGDTAVLHKVYLGTSVELGEADLVALLQTVTMYWHSSPLVPGQTYYWRVDEVEEDGVTIHQGDVWSFTVAVLAASSPQPYDGARWIDVNADLGWTPGRMTLSHDVYFSTDRAAVEARDPSVFLGNQFPTFYEPGTLTENTTYYWRVDERTEDDDVYEGPVWSFTTLGPGVGVKAQYFRGVELAGAPILTQIEDAINHSWGDGVVAAGVSDGVSARWTADLEVPFTESYELITTSDDGVRLWLDGRLLINDWRSHGSTDDIVKVDLVAGQIYSLVMEWYDDSGSAIARLWWQSPSIRKQIIPAGPLQLPVHACNPYPGNGAVNADQTRPLHWTAGGSAAEHDVYFGDSAEAVADATGADAGVYQGRQALDETSFDPGGLEWNRTYFWRIDEVNDADPGSPWKGLVWSFTSADFIVVDDFESYTDAEDHRIYQAWLDGFADGSNGSFVGYMTAPFAEQRIVHTGRQSMPVDYNNANSPWYSEAKRQWDASQNWTISGLDTLTLWVWGKPTNGPVPLYVAVEDSSGTVGTVIHSDPAIVTAAVWTPWQIPLSQFASAGVSMTRVKTLYIGLGSRTSPTPGGAGTIYVDDIGVTRGQ